MRTEEDCLEHEVMVCSVETVDKSLTKKDFLMSLGSKQMKRS